MSNVSEGAFCKNNWQLLTKSSTFVLKSSMIDIWKGPKCTSRNDCKTIFNPLTHSVPMVHNGQTHLKNLAAFTARFFKCVWPLWEIIHKRIKNWGAIVDSKLVFRGVFSTLPNMSDEVFCKISWRLLAVSYFCKTLHLGCLTGFWIHLWHSLDFVKENFIIITRRSFFISNTFKSNARLKLAKI